MEKEKAKQAQNNMVATDGSTSSLHKPLTPDEEYKQSRGWTKRPNAEEEGNEEREEKEEGEDEVAADG